MTISNSTKTDETRKAVAEAINWLRRRGSKAGRDKIARYAIPVDRAFGLSMPEVQALAKRLGRNHALAEALWKTGWYEARLAACYVAEPSKMTPAQMNRWCRGFDNWAICDTACFVLFDHTPHAWAMVEKWADERRSEFVKRAGFALLWALSVHDKSAADSAFVRGLALIERAAPDERHYVKKAVNMALRAIGKRNAALHRAAMETARRLAESSSSGAAARWVGKDALRELTSAAVARRLLRKRSGA